MDYYTLVEGCKCASVKEMHCKHVVYHEDQVYAREVKCEGMAMWSSNKIYIDLNDATAARIRIQKHSKDFPITRHR